MDRSEKLFKSLFYITLMIVTFLSLIPSDSTISFNHQDKLKHFIAYSVLSFLCQIGYWTKKRPYLTILLSLLLIGYSIAIEWLQQFTYRNPSWYDVIANGTGVVTGLIIAKTVLFGPEEESRDKLTND